MSSSKQRKKRDPRAPKGYRTAFNFFIKANHCGIGKEASDKWKTLDNEEKREYYDKAQTDSERYRGEMKEYRESGRKEQWEKEQKETMELKTGAAACHVQNVLP